MKAFILLLVLCSVALTIAPSATESQSLVNNGEVAKFNARRLKLPGPVKKVLKGAAQFFVGLLIDCLFSYATSKLPPNIPLLKNIVKGATAVKDKIKGVVLKKIGDLIDKLRRIRRIRLRRMGLFSKIKKAAKGAVKGVKKAAEGVKKAGDKVAKKTAKAAKKAAKGATKAANKAAKGAKKAAKKVGKKIVKVAKKAGKAAIKIAKKGLKVVAKVAKTALAVAKAIDGLTGGLLQKALMNVACPYITKAVCEGLDKVLRYLGFVIGLPPCVEEKIREGCKTLVKKAFKRHRMLRRMGYVTGEWRVKY